MESGSGSEQLEDRSGNEQESSEQPPKKKRYHRHTAAQIQEMEAYVTNLFLHISLIFLNIYEYMPLTRQNCHAEPSLLWILSQQNHFVKTQKSTLS